MPRPSPPPQIRVLDSSGKGVAGRKVFAVLTVNAGHRMPDLYPLPDTTSTEWEQALRQTSLTVDSLLPP